MNDVNRSPRNNGEVRVHDAALFVWEEPNYGKRTCGLPDGYKEDFRRTVLHPLIRFMRRRGWYVHRDPRVVKHYRCLRQDYRRCWHPGGLQCKLRLSGRTLEIQFYQNRTKPDNPAGGEYDFHKMERMPYLLRLRTQLEMKMVCTWLMSQFLYGVKPEQQPCDAFHLTADEWLEQWWVRNRFEQSRPDPATVQVEGYNSKCMDGVVRNGDKVFFLGSYVKQRWGVGIAEHNINNMWWIKVGQHSVFNVASHHLSHARPEGSLRGRVISEENRRRRLEDLMLRAAKEQRYLDAERMRVALKAGCHVPRKR
jgi:hypothetical protein